MTTFLHNVKALEIKGHTRDGHRWLTLLIKHRSGGLNDEGNYQQVEQRAEINLHLSKDATEFPIVIDKNDLETAVDIEEILKGTFDDSNDVQVIVTTK